MRIKKPVNLGRNSLFDGTAPHRDEFNSGNLTQREGIKSHLECMCWCQASIIKVPQKKIKNGLTESCGRKNCHA